MANYFDFSLYLLDEHFDHCQKNWIIFTCLTPVEPKNMTFDLFVNNLETVRRR